MSDIHDTANGERPGEPASVAIIGARNGTFSGKVVVAAAQTPGGFRASVSDLRQGGSAIPAGDIVVRYGVPWPQAVHGSYRPPGSDILLESPPAEFPSVRGGGVVLPVWVTVRVPKGARPGTYTGQLTVQVKGRDPIAVPVALIVKDWTLPDTRDWRTWIELVQSPDTLAVEYGIPLWSEQHWRMIAKAFDFIGQTGSRVVYIPLIAETNQGNSETMVRWVTKGEGKYDYDFSVMDRYLDLAEKHMGKPKIVVFYAWDVCLKPPDVDQVVVKEDDKDWAKYEKEKLAARYALRDKGPAVTAIDPVTGKTETIRLPRYDDPVSKSLWQPLWAKLRSRMQKRGLADAMMIGVISDIHPTRGDVAFLNEVSGGLPWTSASHHAEWLFREGPPGGELYGIASVGYTVVALDYQYTFNPAKGRLYGWKKPVLHGQYWRFQCYNMWPLNTVRSEAECNITGNQRGMARIGADFWYVLKDKRGRIGGTVAERYPQSYWHSMNFGAWLLGPGKDGPVATARFEIFREGIQECEARIAIESVLTDDLQRSKIGADLADRAQATLDKRLIANWQARGAPPKDLEKGVMTYYRDIYALSDRWDKRAGQRWFLGSGWDERAGKLFATAGEVTGRPSGR